MIMDFVGDNVHILPPGFLLVRTYPCRSIQSTGGKSQFLKVFIYRSKQYDPPSNLWSPLVNRFYLQVGLVLLAASCLLIVVSLLQCYRSDLSSSTPGPDSHEGNSQERNWSVPPPEGWSAEADSA